MAELLLTATLNGCEGEFPQRKVRPGFYSHELDFRGTVTNPTAPVSTRIGFRPPLCVVKLGALSWNNVIVSIHP
jgi:hypothetical protein